MVENNKSKLDVLTLKDNFMFGVVMCEPENCRLRCVQKQAGNERRDS